MRAADGSRTVERDLELIELVDSLVEAVDAERSAEIERLRFALEPFAATALFDAELRLNAHASLSAQTCCSICGEAIENAAGSDDTELRSVGRQGSALR